MKHLPKNFSLGIVFPVYNERHTIEPVLKEWIAELNRLQLSYTIVVCEDGSTDGTSEFLRKIQKKYKFLLSQSAERRGYGGAVLAGIALAPTTHILSVDSDGQCDPADLEPFLQKLGAADVLIGWRQNRADALQRKIFSQTFHTFFTMLFPTKVHDPSAPFVIYPKTLALQHETDLRFLKEGFWWGFVAMCVKHGYTIAELPMNHRPRLAGDTQVYHLKKIPDIALRNGIGLLKLRFLDTIPPLLSRVLFCGLTQTNSLYSGLQKLSILGQNIATTPDSSQNGELVFLKYVLKATKKESPRIILDVGANHGDYTQYLTTETDKKDRIFCLEPSPTIFPELKKRFPAEKRLSFHNIALGKKDGAATLYADNLGSTLGSFYQRGIFAPEHTSQEQVTVKSLSSFCHEQKIDAIDFLKLDVEGNELEILVGAQDMLQEGKISFIQFEFGGCNIDSRTFFRDYFRLLQPHYDLYRIAKNGLIPLKEYHETLEVFVYANYAAIWRA